VKLFFFLNRRPSRNQPRPFSEPPRMWAMAKIQPRSTSDSRVIEKLAGIDRP
jgi:hypothetical protein